MPVFRQVLHNGYRTAHEFSAGIAVMLLFPPLLFYPILYFYCVLAWALATVVYFILIFKNLFSKY